MLYPAYKFKEQLEWCFSQASTDPAYDWWHGEYAEMTLDVDESFWTSVQFVSINPHDKGRSATSPIVGYMKAHIRRPHFYVDAVNLVNFDFSNKNIYAVDARLFFKYLVAQLRVRKIIWGCGEGSPARNFYARVKKVMDARTVGKYTKHWLTPDNDLHDYIKYEFINDCFACTHCGHAEKRESEIICWKCGLGEMVYHEVRPAWVKKVKYNGVSF